MVSSIHWPHAKEMKEVYQQFYNSNLVEDIDNDVSGDFKKILHATGGGDCANGTCTLTVLSLHA